MTDPPTTTTTTTTTEETTTTTTTTTTTPDPCPCEPVRDNIGNGFVSSLAKYSQAKQYAAGANSFAYAISQTIHDVELTPGMTNQFDGYLVMRKYETCDASVLAAMADDSVSWWFTDLNQPDYYTTHHTGYFKSDVSNKKKTFTLGYSFNGDLAADTNKDNKHDKYVLIITGLQALGVTEEQAFDCIIGSKPAAMLKNDAMNDGCDYSKCVGEKVLIW